MALLDRRGLGSGDLTALRAAASGELIEPTVFLTFDDGFQDNHDTVLPLLRSYRRRAFVFVLPPLVDVGASLRWPEVEADLEKYPGTMRSVTWSMLGEMREGGFEVGSHTLSHPSLPELHGEELRDQLWDSRSRIIEQLGSCETFAYPFGSWSPEVAAAAADCGYSFAFTLPTKTGQRRATPLSIPRINVDFRDDECRFGLKLSAVGKELFLSPRVASTRRALAALKP